MSIFCSCQLAVPSALRYADFAVNKLCYVKKEKILRRGPLLYECDRIFLLTYLNF